MYYMYEFHILSFVLSTLLSCDFLNVLLAYVQGIDFLLLGGFRHIFFQDFLPNFVLSTSKTSLWEKN